MAYSELLSFIREQLKSGRDPRTIREYLVNKNIDSKAVDQAFDEIFNPQSGNSTNSASLDNKHVEKFVFAGVVVLILAFAGVGIGFYYNSLSNHVSIPVVESPSSSPSNPSNEVIDEPIPPVVESPSNPSNDIIDEPIPPVVEENLQDVGPDLPEPHNNPSSEEIVCDFDDPEEKYQCYIDKFENDEVQCHKITDIDEREFCYIAQDLYVLSA